MIKVFDYLQYLFFPFFVLTIYFIIKGSLFEFNLEEVGFGILCMGIAFGFTSMGDIKKVSDKEKKLFSDKKRFNRVVVYYVSMGIIFSITTLFFVAQKWMQKGELGHEFFSLGLNFSPMIIAVFFTLKQLVDKKQYFESLLKIDRNKNDLFEDISEE
jgi:polyferredoxin